MGKKTISLTLPPDLVDQIDEQVEKTGAKSRSAFISDMLRSGLSNRAIHISLTDEELAALQVLADANPLPGRASGNCRSTQKAFSFENE